MTDRCGCQAHGLLKKAREGGVFVRGKNVRIGTDGTLHATCKDCGREHRYGASKRLLLATRAMNEEGERA